MERHRDAVGDAVFDRCDATKKCHFFVTFVRWYLVSFALCDAFFVTLKNANVTQGRASQVCHIVFLLCTVTFDNI